MSVYSTSILEYLRMCGYMADDSDNSVRHLISTYADKVFDFEYDFYNTDTQAKSSFEQLFCMRYLMEEVGQETIELFKINLWERLMEIMPYYSGIWKSMNFDYAPLNNYELNTSEDATYSKKQTGLGTQSNNTVMSGSKETNITGNNSQDTEFTPQTTTSVETSKENENTRTDNLQQTDSFTTTRTDDLSESINANTTQQSDYQELVSDTPQVTVQTNDYASSLVRREQEDTGTETRTRSNTGTQENEGSSNSSNTGTVKDAGSETQTETTTKSGKDTTSVSGTSSSNANEESSQTTNVTGNTTNTLDEDTTNNLTRSVTGFSGADRNELVLKYRETIIKFNTQLLDEFKNLFMGVF